MLRKSFNTFPVLHFDWPRRYPSLQLASDRMGSGASNQLLRFTNMSYPSIPEFTESLTHRYNASRNFRAKQNHYLVRLSKQTWVSFSFSRSFWFHKHKSDIFHNLKPHLRDWQPREEVERKVAPQIVVRNALLVHHQLPPPKDPRRRLYICDPKLQQHL